MQQMLLEVARLFSSQQKFLTLSINSDILINATFAGNGAAVNWAMLKFFTTAKPVELPTSVPNSMELRYALPDNVF